MAVILRNPHSVLALLDERPDDLKSVHVPAGSSEAWEEVKARVQVFDRRLLGPPRSAPGGGRRGRKRKGEGRESGAEASIKPKEAVQLADLFAGDGEHRLILGLDHIQDPHNLGAIFRTAAFYGVDGIVLTRDRSAPLTSTAYDVASGGVEYVPFAMEANLTAAVDMAKSSGFWTLATTERVEEDISELGPDRNWMVFLGNEELGLRRGLAEQCDELRAIVPQGGVTSLNVSVAAGIILNELR